MIFCCSGCDCWFSVELIEYLADVEDFMSRRGPLECKKIFVTFFVVV